MKKLILPIILLAIVVGIPLLIIQENDLSTENAEVRVPIMNNSGHQLDVSMIQYNSNPPTSGPHFADWHTDWTFYEEEQPIGGLIHNMEHGGVVIFYDKGIRKEQKQQLSDFVDDTFKIIASPYQGLNAPIVLAAWGVYEEFQNFDQAQFERFYKMNLNNAPENVYP